MKRSTLGLEIHKQRITDLAACAMREVVKTDVFKNADIREDFLLSRLKTRVKVVRRGETIRYFLAVPEINQSFFNEVMTSSEFQTEVQS
jgi:hypothetical protein